MAYIPRDGLRALGAALDNLAPGAVNYVDVEGCRFYRFWNSRPVVQQADIDGAKVDSLVRAIDSGVPLPRVILADFGDSVLAIDGHHRSAASRAANSICYAWICDGDEYDSLSCDLGSFEADRLILETLAPHIAAGY